MTRSSGPRPSFDDGRDLAMRSSLENAHLRDLWAYWLCDAFVSLCLRGCDALCLCVSVAIRFDLPG